MPSSSKNRKNSDHRPPKEWIGQQFARLELRLHHYALRMGSRPELASDAVQEAFVKLCQQPWPEIEEHATAWLYRTCRNRIIDDLRREGRMNAIHSGADPADVQDRALCEPADQVVQDEQILLMRNSIRGLPVKQQEVLRLRLHDGLSYKQIADVLGLTASNVGYMLHQAIGSLRKELAAK